MTTVTLQYIGMGIFAIPHNKDKAICASAYQPEQYVEFTDVKPRSKREHNWWFAIVSKAFKNLPEHLAPRFPSAEHLRAYVLVSAGYCTMATIPVAGNVSVKEVAAALRLISPFAVIRISDSVINVFVAKSQSEAAQKAGGEFREVVEKALQEMASMLGCDPVELLENVAGVPAWVTEGKVGLA